jgi:hypothetical protein
VRRLHAEDDEIEEGFGTGFGDGVAEDFAAREDLEDGFDDDVGGGEAQIAGVVLGMLAVPAKERMAYDCDGAVFLK